MISSKYIFRQKCHLFWQTLYRYIVIYVSNVSGFRDMSCQKCDNVCRTRDFVISYHIIFCPQFELCRRQATSASIAAKIPSKVSVAWHSTKRQVLYVPADLVKVKTQIRDILRRKKVYFTQGFVNQLATNAPKISRNLVKPNTISGLRRSQKIC